MCSRKVSQNNKLLDYCKVLKWWARCDFVLILVACRSVSLWFLRFLLAPAHFCNLELWEAFFIFLVPTSPHVIFDVVENHNFFSGRAISETSHFWARGLYTASHLLSFMVRLLHVYTYGVWVCWGYNCAHFVFTFTRRLYIYIMYEVAHADFRVSSLQCSFVVFRRPPTRSFRRHRVGGNQNK